MRPTGIHSCAESIPPFPGLREDFFTRTDVLQVARDLLGKYLLTCFEGKLTAGKIVETEAYRGPDDKACHAWMNRRTSRTEIMFAPGGHAYVYLCYGIHHLFNIVTGEKDMAHAVLIRAIEPTENVDIMLQRRNMDKLQRRLTAGPGSLTQALGISTAHSGLLLTAPDSPIWLEDRGCSIPEAEIVASPRVGVQYAAECALWDWRFRIRHSAWTSPAA